MSFPYEIEAPVPAADDKGAYIEKWLTDREALHPQPHSPNHPNAPLRKYYPKNRDQTLDLIALSETCLRDCVPHLDVGDAFAILGAPSLTNEFDTQGDSQPSEVKETIDTRQDLIDILSGHATLMSPPEETDEAPIDGFAPWSLRYSGHQFGSWAGQLGDGRAVTIRYVIFQRPSPLISSNYYIQMLRLTRLIPNSPTSSSLKDQVVRPSHDPQMA